jgi:RNA polymerase sigma factor (sigma-70 family)
LDGGIDAKWVPLTPLDWHSLYPDDAHWREAAILSLARLAHTIAADLARSNAGGEDLFSAGLLAIAENIDEDVPAKCWSTIIRRQMTRWLRREARNEHLQRIHDAYTARNGGPLQPMLEHEVAVSWESCLSTDRRRRIFDLKAKGWTEQQIADKLKIGRGAVQQIIRKVYEEACAKLGLVPKQRKTRGPGHTGP